MKSINRIVLSGGGTGGHIYPALALYRRLKSLNPDLEVLYIGTQRGLESKIVPKEGLSFQAVEISGIKRSLSLDNFKVLIQMFSSTGKAQKLIKSFKPDVVLGTGGYVCGPVLLAAALAKFPTVIHEQNLVAGVTNKFLARFVDRIATCFPEAKAQFGRFQNKVQMTGNPRGQEVVLTNNETGILSRQFNLQDQKRTILIFGGSRGAPAINKAGLESVDHWLLADYQVILAMGQEHYNDLEPKEVDNLNTSPNLRIVPYIDNMPSVFRAIDLVICRAGATTLTELTALGLPSILIPSPYVTANHQEHNALSLVNQGAALMIKENELTTETLIQAVDKLMDQPELLEEMSMQAKEIGIVDASDRLINMMQDII